MTYHFTNGIYNYLGRLNFDLKYVVHLEQLNNSICSFYLKDDFRKVLIKKAIMKAGSGTKLAKALNMNRISYLELVRGRSYKSNKLKFFSSKVLFNISNISGISLNEIERQIILARRGLNGSYETISFPINIEKALKETKSINRDIIEGFLIPHMFKTIRNQSKVTLPDFFIKENKFVILDVLKFLNFSNYCKTSRREIKIKVLKDSILLDYTDPVNSSRISKVAPRFVRFDTLFSKQLGKWLGDHGNGINISNVDICFISEFASFIKSRLLQNSKDIIIKVINKFPISKYDKNKIIAQVREKISIGQIKFYTNKNLKGSGKRSAFEVYLKNSGPIFRLCFEPFVNCIDQIFYISEPSIRYAFYAGYIEAEGSFHKDNNKITIPFSSIDISYQKINEKWLEALRLAYWINFDKIPAKIGRSVRRKKCEIDYRVDLGWNSENRILSFLEVKNKILPFLNKQFYKYMICTDILNNKRTKPSHKLYLSYIMNNPEIEEVKLAQNFNKNYSSLRQRVLIPLLNEGLLNLSLTPRRYRITDKGVKWLKNIQTRVS